MKSKLEIVFRRYIAGVLIKVNSSFVYMSGRMAEKWIYGMICLFLFTFGYELGLGRIEVRAVRPQLTKAARIERIETERAKRLATKVTQTPEISPSAVPSGTVTNSPVVTPSATKPVTPSATNNSAVIFGGTIESISAQNLLVKNEKGEKKSFVITEDSVFVDKKGKSGAKDAFKVGDEIIVFGTFKEGKNYLVRAKEI